MKPILFNTEMVQAILEGRKTETRRVIKPQPGMVRLVWGPHEKSRTFSFACCGENVIDGTPVNYDETIKAPYWTGDVLWVRETWRPACLDIDTYFLGTCVSSESYSGFNYKSDMGWYFPNRPAKDNTEFRLVSPTAMGKKWHPSIHMPKKAARLFLRVTDVRVERLQEITAEGTFDEGIDVKFPEPKPPYISLAYTEMRLKPAARHSFAKLWDSTIKPADKPTYGWDANPWCWVIKFKRITKREAGM